MTAETELVAVAMQCCRLAAWYAAAGYPHHAQGYLEQAGGALVELRKHRQAVRCHV